MVVLGRNVLNIIDLKWKSEPLNSADNAFEILHIDVSNETNGWVDKLDVNSEIPVNTQDDLTQMFEKEYYLAERLEKLEIDEKVKFVLKEH